jgi:hypothetical protein
MFTIGALAKQRAYWHINNYGWNSAIDYHPDHDGKPLIAIIGDSFIEAFQVGLHDNISAKLREKLGGKCEVYSFGMSGAALSQYLQISRYVNKYFKPNILVINVVHNDFDESLCVVKRQNGMLCLEITDSQIKEAAINPYVPNKIRRFMANSYLIRYLWSNFRISFIIDKFINKQKTYNANIDISQTNKQRDNINIAIDYIVKKIRQENSDKEIIFMIDAPRMDIYANNINKSNVVWMNSLLKKTCDKYSVCCIDLTEPFNQNYKISHIHFESSYDYHWNEYGHNIAAEILYNQIKLLGINNCKYTEH